MKRIITTLVIILGIPILMQAEIVSADNNLNSIEIDIELTEDGSAIVNERRQMTIDEGTEGYIEMNNLQDSELISFSVDGFEYNSDWDSSDSREEKEGLYGVIEDGDDLELVWGLGEYGERTYELTYTLSNVVRNLEDGQALLWNFDTFLGTPTDNLTLTLDSPLGLTQENTNFWGYGFRGDLQMEGDQIVWRSEESLDSGNDVTLMLQFPPEFFNASQSVDMTLEEQREMANAGSSYAQADEDGGISTNWILGLIFAFAGGVTALISGLIYSYYRKVNKLKKQHNSTLTGRDRVKKNTGIKRMELADYGDDIANVAYLLQELMSGHFEDYFAAYLLKWLQEEKIDIETITTKKTFSTKYTTYIHIHNYAEEKAKSNVSFHQWVSNPPEDARFEDGMWLMLLDAADNHGEIDSVVMTEWGKENADLVTKFSDYLKEYSMKYLEDNGYMTFTMEKVWKYPVIIASASPKGDELFDQVNQHINYLEQLDMTKDPIGDQDMTQLLIWSIIGGNGGKINKQFSSILPTKDAYNNDYNVTTHDYYPYYWHQTMHFRQNWSTGLSSGGFHSVVVSSDSGGSGGSTFSGGGGGAGGGGGGGTR